VERSNENGGKAGPIDTASRGTYHSRKVEIWIAAAGWKGREGRKKNMRERGLVEHAKPI